MSSERLKISIGSDNFKKIVSEYDIYVDKSLFIKEIIDHGAEAILITKPRRWGKTTNMDMLKTFLSIEVDEMGKPIPVNSNLILFQGGKKILNNNKVKLLPELAIAKVDNGTYITEHQGKYPVIFLSLKETIGNTVDKIGQKLKDLISELYIEHKYIYDALLDSKNAAAGTLNKYQMLMGGTAGLSEIESSLLFLSKLLYNYHHQEVYILIDEYDRAVNDHLELVISGQEQQINHDIAKLITSMLSAGGKFNPYIKKLILTGVFDTLQKKGASSLNNIAVYGIDDINFSTSFGFSFDEVKQLVKQLEFKENSEIVLKTIKDWYNGYSVPISSEENIRVYTPWSVIRYLEAAYNNNQFEAENYWPRTGAMLMMQNLLKLNVYNSELGKKLHSITTDNEVKLEFDESISLFEYDLNSKIYDEQLFSYLLLNSGYLTTRKDGGDYYFRIPNHEVKAEFIKIINLEIKSLNTKIEGTKNLTLLEYLTNNQKVLIKKIDLLTYDNNIVEAFYAIASKDNIALKNIFDSNKKPVCSSKHFNFFHIAAAVGDEDIFATLLERCDNKLLFEKDGLKNGGGLKPIDYAYLGRDEELQARIKEKGGGDIYLKTPDMFIDYLCWEPTLPIAGTVISILYKLLVKHVNSIDYNAILKYGVFILTSTAGAYTIKKGAVKLANKSWCNDCDNYNAVDISNPKSFNLLTQLEKYKLNHEHAYVTLNGECGEGDSKVTSVKLPLSNLYQDRDYLTFTLCEQSESFEVKDL